MEHLGLAPALCLARNPRLVYGRMTGWGQHGPLAHAAGHDLNYVAMSGALHAIGSADAPPPPPLNYVGDYGGGAMLLAFGLMCALHEAAGAALRRPSGHVRQHGSGDRGRRGEHDARTDVFAQCTGGQGRPRLVGEPGDAGALPRRGVQPVQRRRGDGAQVRPAEECPRRLRLGQPPACRRGDARGRIRRRGAADQGPRRRRRGGLRPASH